MGNISKLLGKIRKVRLTIAHLKGSLRAPAGRAERRRRDLLPAHTRQAGWAHDMRSASSTSGAEKNGQEKTGEAGVRGDPRVEQKDSYGSLHFTAYPSAAQHPVMNEPHDRRACTRLAMYRLLYVTLAFRPVLEKRDQMFLQLT